MSLRVVARIQARPETVDEVRELLLALIKPTRQEQGCVTYELLQNHDDPCDFTFVEEWACDADLAAHAASDHLRAIGARLAPVVAAAPDIRRYELLA